jgi:hypothetical protein
MERTETLIMVASGLAIGTIVAALGLAAFNYSLTGSVVPSIPIWTLNGLFTAYACLGFAATLLSTRFALRKNPVRAVSA